MPKWWGCNLIWGIEFEQHIFPRLKTYVLWGRGGQVCYHFHREVIWPLCRQTCVHTNVVYYILQGTRGLQCRSADSVLQLRTCSMYKLYSMSSLFSYVHIYYFLRVWNIKRLDSCDQPGLDEFSHITTYNTRPFQTGRKKAKWSCTILQEEDGGLLAPRLERSYNIGRNTWQFI